MAGSDRASLPVLGKIAAGVPIEAIQHEVSRISPPGDFAREEDHFALQVEGESMIGAGIHDGDLIILKRTDTAQSGDIVVALIDEEEATLKHLRSRGDSIALEAANPAFRNPHIRPDPDRVPGRASVRAGWWHLPSKRYD